MFLDKETILIILSLTLLLIIMLVWLKTRNRNQQEQPLPPVSTTIYDKEGNPHDINDVTRLYLKDGRKLTIRADIVVESRWKD